ncbi:hypothetical protein [Bradyrhizobium sp. RT5a]|uniref:hypothetical protein n=1 Tax=unclassified Bradyrhizobium TaxID=2631580 RepID=UPI003398142E
MKVLGLILAAGALLYAGFVIGECYQFEVFQKMFETPGAAVGLIAAAFALVSGVGGPTASYLIGSRQAEIASKQADTSRISAEAAQLTALNAGSRELAKVRLTWLEALRDNLAEYHSILMSAQDPHDKLTESERNSLKAKWDEDERRLSYLGTQLDLLLNQEKPLQKALWAISDDILTLKTKTDRQAKDADLVVAARAVIDFEWQKIKREMRGSDSLNGPSAS